LRLRQPAENILASQSSDTRDGFGFELKMLTPCVLLLVVLVMSSTQGANNDAGGQQLIQNLKSSF
jgi:hypothetical protein